CARKRAMDYW
nr:immunoglobulin heavy chain junction region [Mus musculus]